MEPVYFYKQNSEPWGVFSNFYPADIRINSLTFHCNEQYIMYMKASVFEDWEVAQAILKADSPGEIKRLGRRVRGFQEDVWARSRESIADTCNLAKFESHPSLRRILMSTGSRPIAEAAPGDFVWGIGISVAKAKGLQPSDWKGQNILGRSLMRIREELQQ